MILGQPDDYSLSQVVEWASKIHAAGAGKECLDFREECREIRDG